MTNPLEGLTDREREQLRYIVEKVQEWPEGQGSLWVTRAGWISGSDPQEYLFESMRWNLPVWPTYSPLFTRAQYDAMKAEMAKPSYDPDRDAIHQLLLDDELSELMEPVPDPIDYRAHCEALAGALENARPYVVALLGEPHPYSCTIYKAVVEHIDKALTRWKEDSK